MIKLHAVCVVLYFLNIYQSVLSQNIISCSTDQDCPKNSGSICNSDKFCACPNGNIFNIDFTKCLKIAQAPNFDCEDDRQCSSIFFGRVECREGFCSCRQGYRFFGNRCVPFKALKESCTANEECNDGILPGTMFCDKTCQCNPDYYERGDSCRPIAKEKEVCVIDMDCQGDLSCIKGICGKIVPPVPPKATFIDVGERAVPSQKICLKNDDCATIANSFCAVLYQTCMCNLGYVYDSKNGKCITALGETCKDTCEMNNSECNQQTKKCECQKYYITGTFNQKCYKPARHIGDSCLHDRNCYTFGQNSFCKEFKCQCLDGYILNDQLSFCTKGGATGTCFRDQDCQGKTNFKCDLKYNICVCKEKFHKTGTKCLPDLGSSCSVEQCDGDNILCKNNICVCKEGYVQAGTNTCLKEVTTPKDKCVDDSQCNALLNNHGICQEGKCICADGYKYVGNETSSACFQKKFLGDMCHTAKDCELMLNMDQVICHNGFCNCKPGYHMEENKKECKPNGSSVHTINLLLTSFILILSFRCIY